MTVLVTGAGGFVGRQALDLLAARGAEVHAVTHGTPPVDDARATWHRADLLDAVASGALVRDVGATHLLHLAWYSEPGRFWAARENLQWVEATLALLRAFADGGGQRAVLAGTCAEYDLSYGVCSEDETPTHPTTLYGTCKYATGLVASSASDALGIEIARGRIFYLYGPFEHPDRLVASVISALLDGRRAECTAGTQVRDFLHVRDVAGALVHLVDAPVRGAVNIASGEAVEVRDIVARIAALVGREDLVALGARPTPPDDPPKVVGDTRLLRASGFEPLFSLADGLADTVEWWKARGPQR